HRVGARTSRTARAHTIELAKCGTSAVASTGAAAKVAAAGDLGGSGSGGCNSRPALLDARGWSGTDIACGGGARRPTPDRMEPFREAGGKRNDRNPRRDRRHGDAEFPINPPDARCRKFHVPAENGGHRGPLERR